MTVRERFCSSFSLIQAITATFLTIVALVIVLSVSTLKGM